METFRNPKLSIMKYILRNIYNEILKHIQVKECSYIASQRKANKTYKDSNFVGNIFSIKFGDNPTYTMYLFTDLP